MQRKTEIFETLYNTDIADFATAEEIDEFIQRTLGNELKVEEIGTNLVLNRGSVIPIQRVELDEWIDDILAN